MVPAVRAQPQRSGQLPGEHQQQAEAVVGQVFAHQTLLAGEDHVAVLEFVVEKGIDARGDGVNPAELLGGQVHAPRHETQHDVGIRYLLQCRGRFCDDDFGTAPGGADAVNVRFAHCGQR